MTWNGPQTSLYHFCTATGSEVDGVPEKPDGSLAAIEVKASATVGASDLAALKARRINSENNSGLEWCSAWATQSRRSATNSGSFPCRWGGRNESA